MLKVDGFDDCVLGICEQAGCADIIAYDVQKMINKMMSQGMEQTEAWEYFDFNILGAFMGEGTPCFIDTRFGMDAIEEMIDEMGG